MLIVPKVCGPRRILSPCVTVMRKFFASSGEMVVVVARVVPLKLSSTLPYSTAGSLSFQMSSVFRQEDARKAVSTMHMYLNVCRIL